jgi:hypothetical protein
LNIISESFYFDISLCNYYKIKSIRHGKNLRDGEMTKRFIFGFIAIALFVLIVMMPVSAVKVTTGPTYYYSVSQYINKGATVFIGEEHLNFASTGLQIGDTVGYWPPGADRATTAPMKTVGILNVTDITITYSDFGGFGSISDWYYVYPNYTGGALIGRVADPGLDVAIFAPRIATDVSDKAVFRGEDLQFGIANNLYAALTTNRDPVYHTSTGDGYIDLKVKTPSSAVLNQLYTDMFASSANASTLTSINVTTSPYTWGITSGLDAAPGGSASVPPFSWHTGASITGQYVYEPGAYSVWAESLLNNMKANYLNGGAAYSGKTVSQIKTITIVNKSVKVGVFRSGGTWYLDRNDNGMWDGMPTDRTFSWGKQANDIPISGDWNNDGITETGIFRPGGTWFLDMNNNGTWDSTTDRTFFWGKQPGDIPITGDWNKDGITETGIFRPGGTWFLDMNNNGTWDSTTDRTFSWGKQPGDIPVTGDWNNDGYTETGIFRRGAGFYLDMDNNGAWNSPPDNMLAWGKGLNDIPVTGDWNVDNITETGVFRNGDWYLDMNNNGLWDTGTDVIYPLGQPGDRPVTGNWL